MLKLSYSTKAAFHKFLHPFKYGFWCIMNIGGFDHFGMLWEEWDSYAGDGDYGYSYYWTGNRKTTKQLIVEYPHCVYKPNDDSGFDFVVPFFIAWLLVLPGSIYNKYKIEKEIRYCEEYHRTHCFNEESMAWEEKKNG